MFQLQGLTKAYGPARVLQGVDLELRPGEAVCLAGANAAGKTTLLTIAAGLQKADGGRILREGKLGYLPQESSLLEDLTVEENLALWYAANRRPKAALFAPQSPEQTLELEPHRKKRVSRVSGGIKRRAGLAAALSGRPQWLLMDEPFTALDLQSRQAILTLLHTLRGEGTGILFSSHDPAAIAACADRLLLLKAGRIQEELDLSQVPPPKRLTRTIEILANA